jgi:hypothetical protein
MKAAAFAVVLLGISLVCACSGCRPAFFSKPLEVSRQLSANVAGRTVLASVPVPASIQVDGETATISSGPHKLVVERDRVLVDGQELVKISAAAKSVGFYVSREGIMTINADQAVISQTQFPK